MAGGSYVPADTPRQQEATCVCGDPSCACKCAPEPPKPQPEEARVVEYPCGYEGTYAYCPLHGTDPRQPPQPETEDRFYYSEVFDKDANKPGAVPEWAKVLMRKLAGYDAWSPLGHDEIVAAFTEQTRGLREAQYEAEALVIAHEGRIGLLERDLAAARRERDHERAMRESADRACDFNAGEAIKYFKRAEAAEERAAKQDIELRQQLERMANSLEAAEERARVLQAKYDDVHKTLGAMGEETVLAGYPGGDRVQCLANLRQMKADARVLQGERDEALGALGYSVPGETPQGRYKCGICEARGNLLLDADHEWALWCEKWKAALDLVGNQAERADTRLRRSARS
jgi:hypothetical protein